ncbi:glycoside hydrolase family 32 protein [Cellulomonas hominis]|uniref:Glycoside hydrolase family 32 protein n=1 Tax=Cellulomonas hominis TaxID=156981 RepID=A0A7Z8NQU8_9CELL|nr:glycoside hydrolase family 32 protein [Cellulomonas hominis]TKR26640.1 glycoside hydrolase family 32 protein [Cellulomonas hominis]
MTATQPSSVTAPGAHAPHLRPQAHFTARDTWLNDPNGLVFHDGVWHLFFQNNPSGSTWGNISWGHAVSRDLVSWTELPVAIAATSEEMVFSGSAVVDAHNTSGLAGAGETALVAVYTSSYTAHSERPGIQAQSLAYSVDDGATWHRYAGNPVLDIGSGEFRDPKVFWHGGDDGRWIMVAVEATEHRVAIYSSPNLVDWSLESRFGPAHATGGVWECPDLFPLRVRGTDEEKWVLVVSLNPGGIAGGSGTQYFVGDFDGTAFTPDRVVEDGGIEDYDWLDHGPDYYAGVSFSGAPGGRRVTIAWASNWAYANSTPTEPWRSAMSLARSLDLVRCADGRLRVAQSPVLPSPDDLPDGVLVHRLVVPTRPGERSEIALTAGDPASAERVQIVLDGSSRTLTCDRTAGGDTGFHADFPGSFQAPLQGAQLTDLTIVVDGCVVEVYADGGLATVTMLVFPSAPLTEVSLEGAHADR